MNFAKEPLPILMLETEGAQDFDYSDGTPIEQQLLELFTQTPPEKQVETIEKLLRGSPSWPEIVHLSPQRRLLLEWFPFRSNASLLEVGAGCGALTGLFAERVARVDALEPSTRRASIIAHRYSSSERIRVIVGDLFQATNQLEQYDYIALIGVLEYAGRYAGLVGDNLSNRPYLRLLEQARSMLMPGGYLLVAIENQLGLKYLAGTYEDHYGEPLVGIEDYIHDRGIRTFGKQELEALMSAAGLVVQRYYYPHPDYKLPTAIYSDEIHPGSIEHLSTIYPTHDYVSPIQRYIAEWRLARVLSRNHLLTSFSNSLLLICTTI